MEELLMKGYKPSRTVVLASGFDEESSGFYGAGEIANYLEKEYGQDSFAMLVDEGCKLKGRLESSSPD
jgi:Gly-Xaa carboxypeptidase